MTPSFLLLIGLLFGMFIMFFTVKLGEDGKIPIIIFSVIIWILLALITTIKYKVVER